MLTLAGRAIAGADDAVRRYCGLDWSGGPPETWAFRYFDLVPSPSAERIERSDVTACAALHPGLARHDLEYFERNRGPLQAWLDEIPKNIDLADADDEQVAYIATLPSLAGPTSLSLLSKVAHRKRPRLVPMFDRSIVDWYRSVTGERGQTAWVPLITAMRADVRRPANRQALDRMSIDVRTTLAAPVPTPLRVLDIVVWMESAR